MFNLGNEVSYFMLLASNFILNNSAFVNEFHLSPFALSNLNVFANKFVFMPNQRQHSGHPRS